MPFLSLTSFRTTLTLAVTSAIIATHLTYDGGGDTCYVVVYPAKSISKANTCSGSVLRQGFTRPAVDESRVLNAGTSRPCIDAKVMGPIAEEEEYHRILTLKGEERKGMRGKDKGPDCLRLVTTRFNLTSPAYMTGLHQGFIFDTVFGRVTGLSRQVVSRKCRPEADLLDLFSPEHDRAGC